MRCIYLASWALAMVPLVGCGDDGSPAELPPLFEPKPECTGQSITPFAGMHTQIFSRLEIGSQMDGFDLDGNGTPDNKLQAVGTLARSGINNAFRDYSLLIPVEMFDFATAAVDSCVKFTLYLGNYTTDTDTDGADSAVAAGDCNDHDRAILPGATEVAGNFKDDDCDGLADELNDGPNQTRSTDPMDRDGDGSSMAAGDCDDTNNMVRGGTFAEICSDGFDNDCNGVADRNPGDPPTACYPYDASPDTIRVDPQSFNGGRPIIQFDSGEVKMVNGKLQLTAGPSLFAISVPVASGISLTLKITGTQVEADVVEVNGHVTLKNGRLGGVIDARTADTIRGLTVEQIGLTPEDSLLDAIFANALGPLLALPARPTGDPHEGCRSPDIDVDRDGLELFCDTDSDADPATKVVDLCVDGDGTEVRDQLVDGAVVHCTEAVDGRGRLRFPDGISVELNFETAPATLTPP